MEENKNEQGGTPEENAQPAETSACTQSEGTPEENAQPAEASACTQSEGAPEENAQPAETSVCTQSEGTPAEEAARDDRFRALVEGAEGVDGEMRPVEPPKRKRRWLWNLILIAVIGLGVYSMFGISGEISEDGMSFTAAMSRIDVAGLIVLLLVVLGSMTLDCLKYGFINKAVLGKVRPLVALKVNFLGKFYDGVTPFATGGQPMQIYYMTTKGISGAASSAVVLIRYFGSMLAFTVLGGIFMIVGTCLNVLDGVSGKTLLIVFGWVGLVSSIALPLFILAFAVFPRLARRLTGWFIFVGYKLHIVKNKERVMRKALRTVRDFSVSFRIIARRPVCLILFLVTCFAETFLTFSTPYFVMNMFGCDVEGMFFIIMSLNAFTVLGVSFIPTPGNSGVVEGMGVLAFSVAAGATLAWSVLFWRFLTYYIYILIGVIWTIVDLFRKNIVRRKGKKTADRQNG